MSFLRVYAPFRGALRSFAVKKDFHPESFEVVASCACGNSFKTSSAKKEIHVTLCAACHPFYTGAQKFIDTAGRIEKFENKYKKLKKA
jgi:large subunit ribosomal protein L31